MDLRELRQSRGLSQRRIAEAIGVSTQTIRNWEKGQSEPFLKVDQTESLYLAVLAFSACRSNSRK
ncbi:helix-turn-helix domain-containing protein [Leptolyngbya boryana]|uniref:helix-turn-helix domain-containing protein n=1 Tax=Leptolyngbya boryana TaxID=1184 RepID=UPI0003A32355|nr:helix-turn-helix transcriptional regulator [Leptolyngbya sp. FACHB-238]MBD2397436.1 helix-turn-helix transcriptional regulator [Leptolyngbya sp. FACHB-239]MBD2403759.1 helix-turn-helix transcriptional regulator [Leptolyngbya sp. FACHB-402]